MRSVKVMNDCATSYIFHWLLLNLKTESRMVRLNETYRNKVLSQLRGSSFFQFLFFCKMGGFLKATRKSMTANDIFYLKAGSANNRYFVRFCVVIVTLFPCLPTFHKFILCFHKIKQHFNYFISRRKDGPGSFTKAIDPKPLDIWIIWRTIESLFNARSLKKHIACQIGPRLLFMKFNSDGRRKVMLSINGTASFSANTNQA